MDVRREFPAVASSLAAIREATAACAREAEAPDTVVVAVVQAVHEAAANAVIHGYGGGDPDASLELAASNGDGWLRISVSDRGSAFRPGRTTPGYGLGMAIIAQLADELQLSESVEHGLVVEMAFRV